MIEEVLKLSPEDQRKLLAKLGGEPVPLLSELEFVSRLQELGVLERPQTLGDPAGQPDSFRPAPTVGEPASEIILEERR